MRQNRRTPLGVALAFLAICFLAGCSNWNTGEDESQLPVLFAIEIEMPGASAGEVELLGTYPLEQALLQLGNVESVRAISQEGEAVIYVEFEHGTALRRARQEVASAVDQVPLAPIAEDPYIRPPISHELLLVAIAAVDVPGVERERLDAQAAIHAYVERELLRRLTAIPNVEGVLYAPGLRRQVSVEFDEEQLAKYGLNLNQVRAILRNHNFERKGTGKETGELLLRGEVGSITHSNDFGIGEIVVGEHADQELRVNDLAVIRSKWVDPLGDGIELNEVVAAGERPGKMVALSLGPDADLKEVRKLVERFVDETKAQVPFDVQVLEASAEDLEYRLMRLQKRIENDLPIDWRVALSKDDQGELLVVQKSPKEFVRLVGPDLMRLREFAAMARDALESVPEVEELGTHFLEFGPSLNIRPDETALTALGLSSEDVWEALNVTRQRQQVNNLRLDVETEIVARLKGAVEDRSEFTSVQIRLDDGAMIPIAEVVDISMTNEPTAIYREQGQRTGVISFLPAESRSKEVKDSVEAALQPVAEKLESLDGEYRIEYSW